MINLNELLEYKRAVIQCHDNPDPDALASAFALHRFLSERGVDAQIVYSGYSEIRKANLLLMTQALSIPLRYIKKDEDEAVLKSGESGQTMLLVTVDCQYGAGNVKKLSADAVAVIDHHIPEAAAPALSDIRPFLGSCSTLIWSLLCEAGFSFKDNPDVCSALYYGLYTDTNSLAEIIHPLDMDLRDGIKYDTALMKRLKNSNLSIDDLSVAGRALNTRWMPESLRCSIFEAEPCDPNILGFTGDLALQVDDIDVCAVFCCVSGGVKLSVRSCVRETMANELAARICEGVGSGGGHKDKAGGFISGDKLREQGTTPLDFLKERFTRYFEEYDLVYSGQAKIDVSAMVRYRKKPIPIGFVNSVDVFPAGTEMLVRTIEGDTFVTADPDTIIMVGICQEIWPIGRKKFEASYHLLDEPYAPNKLFFNERHYEPTVKDRIGWDVVTLEPYVKSCVPTGKSIIYAKSLDKHTKVFTPRTPEGYMFGNIGDWLAVREDDPCGVYVIEQFIFEHTYEKVSDT